jgi:HPt (histidine-containing phosphotransfer) domain-containing protein
VTDPPPTGAAVVDVAVLDELCRDLGGDRELVRAVLRTYLDQLDQRWRAVADAIVDGDADGVHAAAHALTSTSVTLGVRAVFEPTRTLEDHARRGDLLEAPSLLEYIERAIPEVRVALGAW